jgi:hypothetical protein
MADVADRGARPNLLDAHPHAVVGDLAEATRSDRRFTDVVHAAGVAVVTVLDDGDVDVDDVAGLELAVARNAVADDVVDDVQMDFGNRAPERRRYGALTP